MMEGEAKSISREEWLKEIGLPDKQPAMTPAQRYELTFVMRCGEGWQEMEEDRDGDWVKFEDFDSLARQAVALARGYLIEVRSSWGDILHDEEHIKAMMTNNPLCQQAKAIIAAYGEATSTYPTGDE